jgi:hypothetical protein
MSRLIRFAPVVLAAALAGGCSGDDGTTQATTGTDTVATPSAAKITLRVGRTNTGPWVRSLSLKHGADGVPVPFFTCAVWDETRAREGCDVAPGAKLPSETLLRLEQRPPGAALTNPDSPGWGTVGTSDRAKLEVPLSDFVVGLDVPTATYKVTLRPLAGGAALTTSNTITVTWAE